MSNELLELMGEPFPGETLLADGWQYRDIPQMLPEFWDELLGIIGDGNYRMLTVAVNKKPDGRTFKRGQMLISPAGMERLRQRSAGQKVTP